MDWYKHLSSAQRAGKKWAARAGENEFFILRAGSEFALLTDLETIQFNIEQGNNVTRYRVA